jgi:hypothetical protein
MGTMAMAAAWETPALLEAVVTPEVRLAAYVTTHTSVANCILVAD